MDQQINNPSLSEQQLSSQSNSQQSESFYGGDLQLEINEKLDTPDVNERSFQNLLYNEQPKQILPMLKLLHKKTQKSDSQLNSLKDEIDISDAKKISQSKEYIKWLQSLNKRIVLNSQQQEYFSSSHCDVLRPRLELKAQQKILDINKIGENEDKDFPDKNRYQIGKFKPQQAPHKIKIRYQIRQDQIITEIIETLMQNEEFCRKYQEKPYHTSVSIAYGAKYDRKQIKEISQVSDLYVTSSLSFTLVKADSQNITNDNPFYEKNMPEITIDPIIFSSPINKSSKSSQSVIESEIIEQNSKDDINDESYLKAQNQIDFSNIDPFQNPMYDIPQQILSDDYPQLHFKQKSVKIGQIKETEKIVQSSQNRSNVLSLFLNTKMYSQSKKLQKKAPQSPFKSKQILFIDKDQQRIKNTQERKKAKKEEHKIKKKKQKLQKISLADAEKLFNGKFYSDDEDYSYKRILGMLRSFRSLRSSKQYLDLNKSRNNKAPQSIKTFSKEDQLINNSIKRIAKAALESQNIEHQKLSDRDSLIPSSMESDYGEY